MVGNIELRGVTKQNKQFRELASFPKFLLKLKWCLA
jgi:hypothetical protein